MSLLALLNVSPDECRTQLITRQSVNERAARRGGALTLASFANGDDLGERFGIKPHRDRVAQFVFGLHKEGIRRDLDICEARLLEVCGNLLLQVISVVLCCAHRLRLGHGWRGVGLGQGSRCSPDQYGSGACGS
jgi:hypothetical protein